MLFPFPAVRWTSSVEIRNQNYVPYLQSHETTRPRPTAKRASKTYDMDVPWSKPCWANDLLYTVAMSELQPEHKPFPKESWD